MGTLSQRGTIHPDRRVVIFWGAVMGGVAALMLVVGGTDALSGIQNITIIMAAPFLIVMIVMCVALMKDLRQDPLVQRGRRVAAAVEQAVEYGTQTHGDNFFLNVKPHESDPAADGPCEPSPNGQAAPGVLSPAETAPGGPAVTRPGEPAGTTSG
jgi:choline-glycine betaine transporter